MNPIRQRLNIRSSESGLSLIEVLVAMMIFSMLVVGIGYSLISILQMTRDSQTRETAVSLASSELDAVRAIGDPFKVFNVPTRTQTVGDNTYTITRTAAWVSPDGSVDTCGTGGSSLQYKSVSVEVTWAAMRDGARAVTTDTALVPVSRINDPAKGTILVSVKNEAGLGAAGMTFTATSSTVTLDVTPTNVDGCSFVLEVPPGDYTVKLTNANYMDINQSAIPTLVRTVTAGSSAQFGFQYDKRGTYPIRYASNDTDPVKPKIPNNLTTTFFNTNGNYTTQVPVSGLSGTAYLYPAQTGYQVVAGSFVPPSESGTSCESVDPAAWPQDDTKSPPTVATRAPTASTIPGGVASPTPVPMGVLTVKGKNTSRYLFAVSQSVVAAPGQPTCAITTQYAFGDTFTSSSFTTQKIALPFGSWKLYVSSSAGSLGTAVPAANLTLVTPGQLVGTDGTFVLDPRGVTP